MRSAWMEGARIDCNGLFVFPQNPYVEAVTQNLMVFEDEILLIRIRWSLECGTLMMKLVLLQKETPESFLLLFLHPVRAQQEDGHLQAKKRGLTGTWSCWHVISDFQVS